MTMICICTTPRSGSESFCKALRDGGLHPAYEIAHPFYRAELAKSYGADLAEAPVAEVFARLSQIARTEGPMAVKLFFPDMQEILRSQPMDDVIFVHLERRDLAEQTVSFLAMWATGRATDIDVKTLPFDTSAPDTRNAKIAVAYLRSNRRSWRAFLSDRTYHAATSEDIFATPEPEMGRLARFLDRHGVAFDADAAGRSIAETRRYSQDSALKSELRERFADILRTLPR